MRRFLPTILTTLFATACASVPNPAAAVPTQADDATQRAGVETALHAYEQALNAANVADIAALYTADAVFMAQHQQPSEGIDAVRSLYEQIFAAIRLDIVFTVDEVEIIGDTAWARTRSAGTTTVVANGDSHPEANQEMFVLKQLDGAWKIHRYIFSTTTPLS